MNDQPTFRAAAAREAARHTDGTFGIQRRAEAAIGPDGIDLTGSESPPAVDLDPWAALTMVDESAITVAERALAWRHPSLAPEQVEAIRERALARARERVADAAADVVCDGYVADRPVAGGANELLPEGWAERCRKRAAAIRDGGANDGMPREVADGLALDYLALAERTDLHPAAAHAVLDIVAAHRYAERSIDRQIAAAAVLSDVDPGTARVRFNEFREHYLTHLAHLPEAERPEPPLEWTDGFTHRDFESKDVPTDPATLYAMYRLAADPDAFDAEERLGMPIVSVDLETASPQDTKGMDPRNGRIIEFGAVVVDPDTGEETEAVSFLVNPGDDALNRYGTGAVDVHRINPEDVATQPTWDQRAPLAYRALAGRRLLAQNARFEKDWLAHHLSNEHLDFDGRQPAIDTWRIALQHFDLTESGYRLQSICEHVGVAYTDGHRALHDAEVAARAFVAMRRAIHDRWRADPRNQR